MKIAYFDCFSGISGDMVLGALLDLGVPLDFLLHEFKKLTIDGYEVQVKPERRGAISGTRVGIKIWDQPHRRYADIQSLIRTSSLDRPVRERSLAIFEVLARAESRVHQVPVAEIHFHEVGALDSILDIVGAAIALESLKIDRICSSKVPLGSGFVHTHHGLLPVPAPATIVLLEGVPVYDNGAERELVTPTGAAILAALVESFGPVPDMTLTSVGYGVGSHPASDPPNMLRVLTGTLSLSYQTRRLLLVETSIDDMNPEFYDYLLERLFDQGVLDVNLIPVQMKKNRPAVLLRVLLEPSLQASVIETLFRETTTLGVRLQDVSRVELHRETETVATMYGPCRVKRARLSEIDDRWIPEYEDCKLLAKEKRVPIGKVYEEALLASKKANA